MVLIVLIHLHHSVGKQQILRIPSNTDGTINSTYTSANTTAGFSIVQYTGTGSNATVGHGLGVAPETGYKKHQERVNGHLDILVWDLLNF